MCLFGDTGIISHLMMCNFEVGHQVTPAIVTAPNAKISKIVILNAF